VGPALPVALAPDWERLAGPDVLGRSVVVGPGDAASPPWAGCERVVVDADRPDDAALDRLQAAWTSRSRVVVELRSAIPDDDPPWRGEVWELDPGHGIGAERLRHLVLANAVDARDPGRPRFAPTSAAVAAGATPGGDADVIAPDGRSLWCDGGPLDPTPATAGLAVVPMVHLARHLLRPLRAAEPAADLAEDQREAVRHRGGGARIIAPAGSGKTRVLTERARHLVRDLGVDPRAVCLVAFNVRARQEMQERTTDLAGLQVRTLNSLALAILQGTGPFATPTGRAAPEVIDERAVRNLLGRLVTTRRQALSDPFATWIEALSACRLGLRSPTEVERDFGGDVPGLPSVLAAYRAALAEDGVVDFDEQIVGAIEVLLGDRPAREAARRACGVLLVDEFQDLTPAHVLLVRLLSGPAAEVFGVGDDDQTIYGYTGASPAWLIDFAELFPGAGHHDLHVNYRCPPEVVAAAGTLLGHNRRRIPKTITAAPRATRQAGARAPLQVEESDDPTPALVDHVTSLLAGGAEPTSIAVLTRVNATLLAPMIGLAEAGIPADAPIDRSFTARTGVAAALAWLRLATGPPRRLRGADLDVAARRPPRGLSRRVVEWIAEQRSVADLRALAGRMREERDRARITAFADDLDLLRERAAAGASTAEMLRAVRDDTSLGDALDARLDSARRSVDRSAHGDDLAALVAIGGYEPDPAAFPAWLDAHLAGARADGRGVHLSTVHRAKGREWPHVVVHETTDGLFPHRLATDREEERRIFHVALTRCRDSVLVLAGAPPSPFLRELVEEWDGTVEPPSPPPSRVATRGGAAPRRRPGARGDGEGVDAVLRERLREWRLERARADGVPAYVVFTDATLDELCRRRPGDRRSLLAVAGIGPTKVDRYGDAILALLAGVEPPS
jgi:DNA helicase-2/ATP-dependent DNA helicase PcrA